MRTHKKSQIFVTTIQLSLNPISTASDRDAAREDCDVDLGEPVRLGGQARSRARGEVQEEDRRGQLHLLHQKGPGTGLPGGEYV